MRLIFFRVNYIVVTADMRLLDGKDRYRKRIKRESLDGDVEVLRITETVVNIRKSGFYIVLSIILKDYMPSIAS